MTSILNLKYVCAIGLFVVFLFPLGVFAQSSLAISLTPTLINIESEPGSQWSSSIKVINSNDYELTVYTSVVNFAPTGEDGQGQFIPIDDTDTASSTLGHWITLPESKVTIPPQTSVNISFIVSVPESAAPGSHFAALLVGTQPPLGSRGAASVRTSQVVSSLFFLNVDGDIVEDGLIRSFTASNSFGYTPQASFELRFENKGNVHLQPKGDIVIKNMWGKERGRIPVNQHTSFGNALPGTIRKFDFSWTGSLSFGDIGLYKAEVSLVYGSDAKQFVNQSSYFWVLPVKAFFFTLLTIAGGVLFVLWAVRAYIRRMFALVGIDPTALATARQSSTITLRPTVARHELDMRTIGAPVRVGLVDFKRMITKIHSVSDALRQLTTYIINYKLFFAGAVGMVVIVIGIISFVIAVTNEPKEYVVSIGDSDNATVINSEEVTFLKLYPDGYVSSVSNDETPYSIVLINTSGEAGTAGRVAAHLAKEGQPVTLVTSDSDRIDERSVIIFPAELQSQALIVSDAIGGALLSAQASDTKEIKVFIGKDKLGSTP